MPVFRTGAFDAAVDDSWLYEHSEHLFGGDHQQAEGQVCGHLDRATYTDMASSVLLVQMGVDPLDRGTLVVAPRFRRGKLDLLGIPFTLATRLLSMQR